MTNVRGLSRLGLLAFAVGCNRGPAEVEEPVETETPAILPIERETAARPVEAEFSSLEQLLGLPFDHPLVRDFIGDSKIVEQKFEDSRYALALERGFDLLIEGGVVTTIFLYSAGMQDRSEYTEAIPGDVRFGDRAEQLHARLGLPSISGSGWDKWYREAWSLHVEYGGPESGVVLVTLMTAAADPNRS